MEKIKKDKLLNGIMVVVIIGIIVYIAALVYMLFYKQPFASNESLGQFGDFFGSINCLFSAFTLVVITLTLIYQKRDLEDQKNEIIKNREQGENFFRRQKLEELYLTSSKYCRITNDIIETMSNTVHSEISLDNVLENYDNISKDSNVLFDKSNMIVLLYFHSVKFEFDAVVSAKIATDNYLDDLKRNYYPCENDNDMRSEEGIEHSIKKNKILDNIGKLYTDNFNAKEKLLFKIKDLVNEIK